VGACTRHVTQACTRASALRCKLNTTITTVGSGLAGAGAGVGVVAGAVDTWLDGRDERVCGGLGVGVFLLVQRCAVLLVSGSKAAYFPSLYVDGHGEDDPVSVRG
jgi:hypothetical protein